MSTVFTKLRANNRKVSAMGLELVEELELNLTPSGKAIEVPVPLSQLGEVDPVLKPQKQVSFHIGSVAPTSHHLLIEPNPVLAARGFVSCPRLLEPGDKVEVRVNLIAKKGIDLNKVDWLVRLYLIN